MGANVIESKKIIYFLDFPSDIGGSNKVLLTQAYIMRQRGYQVKVVIPNDKKGEHSEEYDRICSEYALEYLTANYTVATCMEEIDIMAALEEYQIIVALLRENFPTVIHSAQLNIAVELAARELGIPHLMNIYQTDEQMFCIDWLDVYPQYHSADSFFMSERWGKGLGILSKCIRVAYDSNKVYERNRHNKRTNIHILSSGVLCERKNQLECIQFVLRCRENGYAVKLTIIGNDQGLYGSQCKKYVEENGLQDIVQFRGFVSNVEDYYADADLFILASRVESYPGVIVESMANRIPVISTPIAGVPELLRDGENGFLTDGYTAENIYDAFLRYLRYLQLNRIDSLVENAYRTYLQHHTFQKVGEELERYYRVIMDDFYSKKRSCLDVNDIKWKLEHFIFERGIDSDWQKMSKLCLLYHILPIMEQKDNKKLMIWGAGFWGHEVFDWIRLAGRQIELMGFVDSYKRGDYLGFPIISSEEAFRNECGTFIIAVDDVKSRLIIMDDLDWHGKVRNRDYFLALNAPIRL